ncbi:HupE/UreJ family protein [Streptomyces sp. NPDC004031]
MSSRIRRGVVTALAAAAAAVTALLCLAQPAAAHGFSSVVYADVTGGGDGSLHTKLELEYDLFVVSAADAGHDDALFRAGTAAFESGDSASRAAALDAHRETALGYVRDRFSVSSRGRACVPEQSGDFRMGRRQGVPYAIALLDWTCPERGTDHEVRSGLFPDAETYVTGTRTIVTYAVDGRTGSAALDAAHPAFSTHQAWYERFWEFFHLGTEHLLTGTDHILFLLALIAGSRRLREVVLAATSFTLAHSVTLLLAALGVVDVPSAVVEPVIALSIAVVAGWHLWRRRAGADELARTDGGRFGLDRAGRVRLGVVFCFGLVHGLGFAGALGIDSAFSWTLLWSLLVFNVGIEAVQLALIALVFPVLVLLRRRAPVAGRWTTGAIAAGVFVMGLVWFLQRILAP